MEKRHIKFRGIKIKMTKIFMSKTMQSRIKNPNKQAKNYAIQKKMK